MSDETTLLPCPFCGGEAECERHHKYRFFRVRCVYYKCDIKACTVWHTSEADAIAAWNTRAELGSEREKELEELVYSSDADIPEVLFLNGEVYVRVGEVQR